VRRDSCTCCYALCYESLTHSLTHFSLSHSFAHSLTRCVYVVPHDCCPPAPHSSNIRVPMQRGLPSVPALPAWDVLPAWLHSVRDSDSMRRSQSSVPAVSSTILAVEVHPSRHRRLLPSRLCSVWISHSLWRRLPCLPARRVGARRAHTGQVLPCWLHAVRDGCRLWAGQPCVPAWVPVP
jgi:hypothetical protein